MPPATPQENPGTFKAIVPRQLRQHSLTPITSSPDIQPIKDTMNGDGLGPIGGKVRIGSASPRVVSGAIGSKVSIFDPVQAKAFEKKITDNGLAASPTNIQTIEGVEKDIKDNLRILGPAVFGNGITQESISQLQKENSTKFNAAIQALLAEYIPSTLLAPHPNIPSNTPNAYVPSILEMEVRHAIGLAARNVYHAHIQDDKKRAAFDFKYAELQERFFGKGKRIANEMKKLARLEKGRVGGLDGGVGSDGGFEESVVRGTGAELGRFDSSADDLITGVAVAGK